MTEKLLALIGAKYPLKELDIGDFQTMKAKGLTFKVSAFEADGFGHVSVMRAKGFFGLMKMDTLIVTPKDVDLPLYSYDRILAFGNDTLICEFYDTLAAPISLSALQKTADKYSSLPERDPGRHWYDEIRLEPAVSKKGKGISGKFDSFTAELFGTYISLPAEKTSDSGLKLSKTKKYVDGLLSNGGPSTDVFIKQFGADKTARFYREVLFGIDG